MPSIYDINYKSEEIFNSLKEYVESKNSYKAVVKKSAIKNQFPIVIFEELNNSLNSVANFSMSEIRDLNYEISIIAINEKNINSATICDELSALVIMVMQRYYGMRGGINAKLFNINESKATKYVLRFSTEWNVARNRLY